MASRIRSHNHTTGFNRSPSPLFFSQFPLPSNRSQQQGERLANVGSALRSLQTFTYSFPSVSPTTPTPTDTRSYLAPCLNLSSGCVSLNNTRCAGDVTRGIPLVRPQHFSESASPPPSGPPRLTFSRLPICAGNGSPKCIPVRQAEVDQLFHEVEPSARVGM